MEKVLGIKFTIMVQGEGGMYVANGSVRIPEGQEREPLTEVMATDITKAIALTFIEIDEAREKEDSDGERVDGDTTDADNFQWN
jgi:DNA-binding cell septation regulator SpoVG